MLSTFLLHTLLWMWSSQSNLLDLMSTADQFFDEFHVADDPNVNMKAFKLLLQRTFDLNEEGGHVISKRSLNYDEPLVRDAQGYYLLSGIEDIARIPAKFPNDINVLISHNLLYIAALEANKDNPENELANDLVLYQYSFIKGIREMGRVPVLGGTTTAIHSFQNITYLVSAERNADNTRDSFQGSTLYKMVEHSGKIYLEKMQILNVKQPNDVKFWEHQDQWYMAIGTSITNDTSTLIYRWMGYHFDLIQKIPGKDVQSVTPFTIGSFMYLAVANFQDQFGNVDIDSEILQFSLQEMKFKPFQKVKTHGALDWSYFKFEDVKLKKTEHFLIVANSVTRLYSDTYTSLTESVVYKFSDGYFLPFQSFKLQKATQWLPIQGPDGEFLLLVSHSYGIFGYQYDGWRFTQVDTQFNQSHFGSRIVSMRAFQYFGEFYLTIADKDTYGNHINLWKLSFSKRNDLEKRYNEIEAWCEEMTEKMSLDNFNQVLEEYKLLLDDEDDDGDDDDDDDDDDEEDDKGDGDDNEEENFENLKLEVADLKVGDTEEDLRDELERLGKEAEDLEALLEQVEENVERAKSMWDIPIVIGSKQIPHLEINCTCQDCCTFKNVHITKLNGEDLNEFLDNAVLLDEDLDDNMLIFEHIVSHRDLSAATLNGHPADTLLDTSSDTFLNAELIVNGTVYIEGDLVVSGLFDGVVPDEKHLVLDGRDQVFDDVLSVESIKVDRLEVEGILNGIPIESLLHEPEIELKNSYKELNVNNLTVEGLVGGYNLTQLMQDVFENSGNQTIEGDLDLISLEADEVIIDTDEISNVDLAKLLEDPCATNFVLFSREHSENADTVDFKHVQDPKENPKEAEEDILEYPGDYIIIVEGVLKAQDISDERNSTSLLDVMTNSYRLNETVIDSEFVFTDVEMDNFDVDIINDIPVASWILTNSTEVQHVRGKKTFLDNIRIRKEVSVGSINGINLKELEKSVLKLNEDQVVEGDVTFDTITVHEVRTNFTNFMQKPTKPLDRIEINGSVTADHLQIDNLTISGTIDGVSWEEFVEDSVFENDEVFGEKIIEGNVRIENLTLKGEINGMLFDEFLVENVKETNTVSLNSDVKLEEPLTVEELEFEGVLDSVLSPNFQREWLLTDGPQIITAPITFENLEMKSGCSLMNETINNTNLRKLFTKSLKINEDTKIKHLYSMGKVRAKRININGTVNGAKFNESVVVSRGRTQQELSGEWLLNRGLIVNGSLIINGHVSGLNVSHLCALNVSADKINLIVGGSVTMKEEPTILNSVNEVNLPQAIQKFWMQNENTTLKGSDIEFTDVEFDGQTTLDGYLNDVNLTHVAKYYLSKSQNRVISEDYTFDHLIIKKWCRMHAATVGGTVNGINLTHWAKNVLLQDEDQVVKEMLRFEIFQTSDLKLNGTVNGLDLSKDVLRYDVSNAVVEGEKTFQAMNVLNLTMAKGKTLQGVDIDSWRQNLVKTTGDYVIKGELTLEKPQFVGNITVTGTVNNITFDRKHLLITKGNQVVTGKKIFNLTGFPGQSIKIKSLNLSGSLGGVDFLNILENQAYTNRHLVFTQPQTFSNEINVDAVEVDGLFQGVNVTEMCQEVTNPIDVNYKKKDFGELISQAKTLMDVVKAQAFFFDYFELIQTLKPNVKAAVPTMDSQGNYLLAMFTQDVMRFMGWNTFSETFVHTDEELKLADNVTFVTSEITPQGSLLYIETTKYTKIFHMTFLKEIKSMDTSCVASFELKPLNKSCIFIGQKWNSSRILCNSFVMGDLQTYQWLDSKGSVQVTVLNIDDEVYIAVINKEEVVDKVENTLTIYRFDRKFQHFYVTRTLAEVNPVALSSVTYKNEHYLVSAGGHLPESVHNSVLSIFRFHKKYKVFVRDQSILVDTPVDVHFSLLPSPQLALYVLTSNPTKPFVMFLYKGISGFVEETSGLSLYPGSNLYSFTDSLNQHFVVISGFGKGQILKAGFKGNKMAT